MRARAFSVATAFTKTEAVQVAVFGFVFLGDALTSARLAAIAIATSRRDRRRREARHGLERAQREAGAVRVASGGLFALAAVGFRGGILALGDAPYFLRATTTLVWSLGIQAFLLGAWLLAFDRAALARSVAAWRQSLFAGFMGAFASQFWFLGFSLTAAANVRTLGLVEVLFAQAVSRRVFGQRVSAREAAGMALVIAGVALLLVAP